MSGAKDAPKAIKILVVEDDTDLALMLRKMISTLGTVEVAYDGDEALKKLSVEPNTWNLVVTDVMMPKVDGLELARRMKKDTHLSRVPVIILTAKAGAADTVAGINAGARFYVTKPFQQDQLLAKVKKALGIR